MGFATGFTGGVTLTLGLAYFTVLAHERNRQHQALYLRSQAQLLHSLIDPSPLPPPISRAELARQERGTLTERFKDRWNEEIENAVRRVERTDWTQLREGLEGAVARLLGVGIEKSRDGIQELEHKTTPKVQDALDNSKSVAKQGLEQAVQGLNRTVNVAAQDTQESIASIKRRTNSVTERTRDKVDSTVSDVKERLYHGVRKSGDIANTARMEAQSSTSGAFDTAGDAVDGVVKKGIEIGREAIEKVQEAVGLVAESVQKPLETSPIDVTDVDKALHERYEKSRGLDKSVEEALADRYRKIDERDNTVLRGL